MIVARRHLGDALERQLLRNFAPLLVAQAKLTIVVAAPGPDSAACIDGEGGVISRRHGSNLARERLHGPGLVALDGGAGSAFLPGQAEGQFRPAAMRVAVEGAELVMGVVAAAPERAVRFRGQRVPVAQRKADHARALQRRGRVAKEIAPQIPFAALVAQGAHIAARLNGRDREVVFLEEGVERFVAAAELVVVIVAPDAQ